jgi:hypothetical protein
MFACKALLMHVCTALWMRWTAELHHKPQLQQLCDCLLAPAGRVLLRRATSLMRWTLLLRTASSTDTRGPSAPTARCAMQLWSDWLNCDVGVLRDASR